MANVYAHADNGVFFNHHAFNDFTACADKAVVFDDGGARLQWLKHAANAYAAREVYVFANLGARADCCPSVYHGAFVYIRANVYIAGHQNSAFGNVAAAPRNGGWHYAHASGLQFGFAHAAKLGGHFVVKRQVTRSHAGIVAQAKAQQHGFFEPLVHSPLPYALACGYAQAACIKFSQNVLNGFGDFFGCIVGRKISAVVPCGFDDLL